MKIIVCSVIIYFTTTCLHGQKITDSKIIHTVTAKDKGRDENKKGWWLTEPVSLIQTNLRETDSDLDPKALITAIKKFPANTLLFSFGGITAHYSTNVKYHYKSDYLPAGKDLVADVLNEAHISGIRVIGRYDFSRTRKEVYDAHPEWFYRRKDGGPVSDDNGLYTTCINGGYYNDKALEILTEALERYDADGFFFNWFGNLRMDYKGDPIGLCHCNVCEQKFKKKYGRSIPDEPDKEYEEFIFQSAVDVAKKIEILIHSKRPNALFMTYINESTDALVSEADLYKWRSLPQWIYTASEQVNSELNTRPDKMIVDLVMPYQEMKYRFGTIAGQGLRVLLYQNLAHGAFPAFVVLGTMDQPDMTALNAVRPVFQFYGKHKGEFLEQKSAARVILYGKSAPLSNRGSGDYRGFFRLLTELHIPFKVTNKITNLNKKDIDLVIVPNISTPDELKSYIEDGGSVLAAGTVQPGFISNKMIHLWENTTSSYMRIADPSIFPSLQDTKVIFCEGEYLELEPSSAPLTFIPPGQFGPPDKVSTLNENTNKPGLVLKHMDKGQVAFIPWHIGDLYYKFSNDKHRMFVSDLINYLLPDHKRQLVTNAHPSVEITLMKQEKLNRTVIHLVNMSGHSGTTFFDAVEMKNISIQVKGEFKKASILDGQQFIPTKISGGYTSFIIPVLKEFCTVFLYK
jgi:Hypothetical glycosyl hydrolase 6